MKYTTIVAILASVLCTGCCHTMHLHDIQSLPASTGVYGGSFLYDIWGYHGSSKDYHFLQYTYNDHSWLHTVCLRIPRSELSLHGVDDKPRNKNQYCALSPQFNGTNISGFTRTKSIYESIDNKLILNTDEKESEQWVPGYRRQSAPQPEP